jgi:hypothetical protein
LDFHAFRQTTPQRFVLDGIAAIAAGRRRNRRSSLRPATHAPAIVVAGFAFAALLATIAAYRSSHAAAPAGAAEATAQARAGAIG